MRIRRIFIIMFVMVNFGRVFIVVGGEREGGLVLDGFWIFVVIEVVVIVESVVLGLKLIGGV